MLSFYVDDILLVRNVKELIVITEQWLSFYFEMKDMGEAEYILEVKIYRDQLKKFMYFSQQTYIKKVFKHFQMNEYKLVDTLAKIENLSKEMCPKS